MELEYLEKRLDKLLVEASKLELDVAYHQIDWAQWEVSKDKSEPPEWLLNKDDELVEPFKHLTTSIYLSIVCYLDSLKLNSYLGLFYREFGEDPASLKGQLNFDVDHYWSGQPYSVWLSRIRQFLSVFPIMESDEDRYRRLSGIQYLENVLDNTASILSKMRKSPKSEPEVYKAVKDVLHAIFPTSKSPRSNFIKSAKEYKPDILIPELHSAVEYKYADTEEKLKSTIEQVAVDAKGYTGDKDYSVFYAVFYVTEDFWGERKFQEFWKELKFPENWRAYYKVGK